MLGNKKGLSSSGHFIFSGLLVVGSLYFLSRYTELNLLRLVWYIPLFIFGIVFPDLVERGGLRRINHRGILHSKRTMWIIMLVLLPLSVRAGAKIDSYWFYATSFLSGYLSHLWGDALTSNLPR
jgi:hypothetical protein